MLTSSWPVETGWPQMPANKSPIFEPKARLLSAHRPIPPLGGFVPFCNLVRNPRQRERVPLQARHICLLFRRLRHYSTDVTRAYVQALEAYRVRHLLVGGSSFHSREEVEAIRNVLTAVEWPDDELAVFASLRGPLFAFTDAQLLSYRTLCSTLHPFKRPPEDLPEALAEVVEALAILRELHRKRNRRPIAESIQTLLSLTRAQAGFANWSTGEQALANIMRLTDMARRAERNGLISFRAFVDWLDEQAESGDVGDAPIMEEGVDGVRIMTVPQSERPRVSSRPIGDITAKDTREPSRWVDQTAGLSAMRLAGCTPLEVQEHADDEMRIEQEEAARVLYVAATRARDLLVVCAVGDHPYDGWLAALNPHCIRRKPAALSRKQRKRRAAHASATTPWWTALKMRSDKKAQ